MPTRDTVVCRHFPGFLRAKDISSDFRYPAHLTKPWHSHSWPVLWLLSPQEIHPYSVSWTSFMLTCRQTKCRWITLSEQSFPPSIPSQLLQWWHWVGPVDEQDTSFAVITPGLCTQGTRKQIGLGSFLPTQLKDTNWGNLQTQTKAEFLFSLLRPLCSLMQDAPFVQCAPGGCSDGLANHTERRGIWWMDHFRCTLHFWLINSTENKVNGA